MEIFANTPAGEGLRCFPVYFSFCGVSNCIWKTVHFHLIQKLLKDANFMGLLSLSRSRAEFFKTVHSHLKEKNAVFESLDSLQVDAGFQA